MELFNGNVWGFKRGEKCGIKFGITMTDKQQ